MVNKITKFLAHNKRVAVMCLDTTELVEEIRKIHDLTPTTTAALGRVATVSTMMAHLNLKETTDNLTIQIKGNGSIGTIVSIPGTASSTIIYRLSSIAFSYAR